NKLQSAAGWCLRCFCNTIINTGSGISVSISYMLSLKHAGEVTMFWIQLYGKDQDGKMKVEPIRQPFFDLKVAIAKAKFIASKTTYHEGFRIINESKAVVREGCSLMPKGPKGEK